MVYSKAQQATTTASTATQGGGRIRTSIVRYPLLLLAGDVHKKFSESTFETLSLRKLTSPFQSFHKICTKLSISSSLSPRSNLSYEAHAPSQTSEFDKIF